MDAGKDDNIFEPLPIKQRMFTEADVNRYCVWAVSGETKEIKADTAYEAFRQSGLKNIIRIQRITNSDQNVIDKAKIADKIVPVVVKEGGTLYERILKQHTPIISADDLDELMRSLSKKDAPVAPPPAAEIAVATAVPVETAPAAPVAVAPVPQPQEPAVTPIVPATGLDVKGEGFDEIIPAAQPKHAVASKSSSRGASGAQPSDSAPTPATELSLSEVEKLLDGKPPESQ